MVLFIFFFFFQAEDGIRDFHVTGVQTCALPICDFLEIEKHPVLAFRSTAVRPTGGTSFELDGDLTIKDITRPVTLCGEFLGWGPNMQGEPMLAASAKTTIDREDWGMTWNMAVEAGGFLVGKKVDLEIEVEAHRVG